MKVMIPQVAFAGDDSHVTVKSAAVEFNREKSGKFVAAVKMAFPNSGKEDDARRPVLNTKITLEAESSRNSKGVRRTVFKASMPYFSMTAADDLTTTPIEPALNRSGSELSMHTVVSIPRSADQDLMGTYGSIGKNGANAQLRLLGVILNAVASGLQQALTMQSRDAGGSYVGSNQSLILTSLKKEEETITLVDSQLTAYPDLTVKTGDHPQVMSLSVDAADCGVELDITDLAKEVCLNTPLGRALNGLEPIRDDEVIALETDLTQVQYVPGE